MMVWEYFTHNKSASGYIGVHVYRATNRGDEWSLRAVASMPNTAIFLRATQKFVEHEQVSTRLNFASKSSKGRILRAVKNFNGPFITPTSLIKLIIQEIQPIAKMLS